MLVPLILFAVCLCPRPPPQSTARMSTPTPNSVMHSRRIRMIQNRVRDLIDKIDPTAMPDDRSSLVANPGLAQETRSSQKRSLHHQRCTSRASLPSPDRRQPLSLPHAARRGRIPRRSRSYALSGLRPPAHPRANSLLSVPVAMIAGVIPSSCRNRAMPDATSGSTWIATLFCAILNCTSIIASMSHHRSVCSSSGIGL